MAKKKQQASLTSTAIKGKLLETIVASMHDHPGVKIERNIRIPTQRNPKRKREIDVLISGSFAGYPARIAIECKNHKSIIDVPYIDAYIGKLQDIGVPTQHGIYISPRGFTRVHSNVRKKLGLLPWF